MHIIYSDVRSDSDTCKCMCIVVCVCNNAVPIVNRSVGKLEYICLCAVASDKQNTQYRL